MLPVSSSVWDVLGILRSLASHLRGVPLDADSLPPRDVALFGRAREAGITHVLAWLTPRADPLLEAYSDVANKAFRIQLACWLVLRERLEALGIPALPLKGLRVQSLLYPPEGRYLMNDMDVLVPHAAVPAIQAVMRECGFRQGLQIRDNRLVEVPQSYVSFTETLAPWELPPYLTVVRAPDLDQHASFFAQFPGGPVAFERHAAYVSLEIDWHTNLRVGPRVERAWERTVRRRVADQDWRVLSPGTELWLLIQQLYFDVMTRNSRSVRQVADLLLLTHDDGFSWDEVLAWAREFPPSAPAVAYVLRFLRDYLDVHLEPPTLGGGGPLDLGDFLPRVVRSFPLCRPLASHSVRPDREPQAERLMALFRDQPRPVGMSPADRRRAAALGVLHRVDEPLDPGLRSLRSVANEVDRLFGEVWNDLVDRSRRSGLVAALTGDVAANATRVRPALARTLSLVVPEAQLDHWAEFLEHSGFVRSPQGSFRLPHANEDLLAGRWVEPDEGAVLRFVARRTASIGHIESLEAKHAWQLLAVGDELSVQDNDVVWRSTITLAAWPGTLAAWPAHPRGGLAEPSIIGGARHALRSYLCLMAQGQQRLDVLSTAVDLLKASDLHTSAAREMAASLSDPAPALYYTLAFMRDLLQIAVPDQLLSALEWDRATCPWDFGDFVPHAFGMRHRYILQRGDPPIHERTAHESRTRPKRSELDRALCGLTGRLQAEIQSVPRTGSLGSSRFEGALRAYAVLGV